MSAWTKICASTIQRPSCLKFFGCSGHLFLTANEKGIMTAPKSEHALDHLWGPFIKHVFSRLENGKLTYGDASLDKSPELLLMEIEQELFDQAGWSFIMWCRLQDVKRKLAQLK